ncbi:MAG: hypothetical protein HYR67_08185 [Bacteroidetes bacterium]|nr:hypothetical protein [Bacteroidota bacterium]
MNSFRKGSAKNKFILHIGVGPGCPRTDGIAMAASVIHDNMVDVFGFQNVAYHFEA